MMSIVNAPAMEIHNKDIGLDNPIVLENHANNSTTLVANVTVITSHKPSQLTKVISLSKEGKMVKTPSAQLLEGVAATKDLTTITDFATLLTTLGSNQALVYGVPNDGITTAKVVTKARYSALGSNNNGFITRTNEHFGWHSGAGIMMFDYDPDGEALDKEAVLQQLYEVCPAIRDVDHLWWMSSSSNIVNNETGEHLTTVTGQRIYVMVNNADDIERAAKIINDKLWLADKGYVKVSASGAMLNRLPFDMSVYQPSRLDFAAGAACVSPLQQNRGEPELIEGRLRSLDTLTTLPDLSSSELEKLDTIRLGKEAAAKPKAQAARVEYIETMKDTLLKSDPDMDDKERSALMTMVLDEKALLPNWVLYVWHEGNLEAITVAELLQNKHYYDGMLCLDPIEPDYDGGRLVAKLYLNQEKPIVYSFARGGHSYALLNKIHRIPLADGKLHDAVNETITIIAERKELFSYGTALVEPINGKLTYIDKPQMKHYLGGIIEYIGSSGKPVNPSNDLVDGVISVGGSRGISPIKGYIDHPMVDPNLRLMNTAGYDAPTQLLMAFDKSDFSITDRRLTDSEVMSKLERIYAPFVGFEVAGGEDKSVLLAAIFSAVVRQVLPMCPAFGIDAPMQGSGKTLLAETISMLAAGKLASAVPTHGKTNDDEFRKRLFAMLIKGDKVCLFDNLVGTFDSPAFAAALTSEYFTDRVLGKSKTVTTLVKTLFLLTGNNMNITGDMSRRVLRMRLAPKNDKLTERKYDFDPVVKVASMRFEIISDVLSLINHWKHCGAPKAAGSMTSYGEWDTLVRQPLAFIASQYPELHLHDVLAISVAQQADSSDKEALIALLIAIAKGFSINGRFKAGAALKRIRDNDEALQDAVYAFIDKSKLQSSMYLGIMLKQHVDRNVEGLVLRSKHGSGSMFYWVELTDDTHRNTIMGAVAQGMSEVASIMRSGYRVAGSTSISPPEMVG